MNGKIKINQLKVNCILGVYEEERTKPQDVFLNIEIEVDFEKSRGDKEAGNTIDWFKLSEEISKKMTTEKYFLSETACLEIAEFILKNPLAKMVKVSILKKKGQFKNLKNFEAEIILKK